MQQALIQSIIINSQAQNNSKFRPAMSNKTLLDHLKNLDRWNLSSKKNSPEDLQYIFENIEDVKKLLFLWLHWNSMDKIVSIVAIHQYQQLRILNVGGNNIVSIQNLQRAKMDKLEELYLWNNKITKIDSIRKMNVPRLKIVDLRSNKVVQSQKFYQINSKCLQRINIQKNQFCNLTPFLKMQRSLQACKILILDNRLIKVVGEPIGKGKKLATIFSLKTLKAEYC